MQLSECCQLLVHQVQSDMLAKIKQTWSMDDVLKKVIEEIQTDPSSYNHFTWQNGEWRRKGKLVVG